MDTSEERVWLRSGPELVWQSRPGEGVVFDPLTGETHFLSDLPSLLVTKVGTTPKKCVELLEDLIGEISLNEKAIAQAHVALGYLEGAELVESRPASSK